MQLTSLGVPTGQLSEGATGSTAKVDGYLRAVQDAAGHRCEIVLGCTRVDWAISETAWPEPDLREVMSTNSSLEDIRTGCER
ncbi:hypothetical protein Pla175_28500 [Pirellulimonas nuda]|uniref:Uncharacterized protein n=1 Tax=Pirellulimonas nuda TaxID=2528009 RepID=A0A518DDB8_9BACT|nr:hypothetical protein [Pirellulimonas nuda]QDU89460.1 hypothetical protein Pla175_28500 [Pirellulimonas nuda]